MVAPFAGAWIEIVERYIRKRCQNVAPFAGAWIEIEEQDAIDRETKVAPFAGAWIEIHPTKQHSRVSGGRSLRGSVD